MENKTKSPDFEILNQFIKDMSFEAPSSPKIFFEQVQDKPNIEIGLEVKTQPAGDSLFEVGVNLKVKNTVGSMTVFLIELSYAAMVVTKIEDAAARENILSRSVPAYLFPFIRGVVADITRVSGFTPFVLAPINFDTIEKIPGPQARN
jgi:preprotein translocase subunit SecB